MPKDSKNVELKQGDEVMLRGKVRAASGDTGANIEVELIGGSEKERPGSFAINSSYATRVAAAQPAQTPAAQPVAPPTAQQS